jgi:anthranilate phosphoribosyltransferase
MNFKEILEKITDRQDLSTNEAELIANSIMKGEIPELVSAAILSSLKTKGEAPEEIIGFVRSMRANAVKVDLGDVVDTAGTGGDGLGTINVSTATAIVISQVCRVAKHGNRAASSKSGSADFLETIGYNINVTPEKAKELISKDNFVFLFAQLYHPAMKNVATVRKTLGIRTIFNFLGPLTNPAMVKKQVMGIFSKKFMDKIATAALSLSYDKLLIIHGEPGMDEVSPLGVTTIYEIKGNNIDKYEFNFAEIIKYKPKISELLANDSKESVIKVLRAFAGKDKAIEEFIKVNSAVALYSCDRVKDFKDGYEYSSQLISTSLNKLTDIISHNGNLNIFKNFMAMISDN